MKTLSIIIPFFNEEKTIEKLLKKVLKVDLSNLWFKKEIILVNDWSTDLSWNLVDGFISINKKVNFKYVNYLENKWKWYAVKKWIEISSWDLILIQDADLEYFPDDYSEMVKRIYDKDLDFLFWSRILWFKKFSNSYSTIYFLFWWILISFLASILCLKKITDQPTGYKVFKRELKEYLLFPVEENSFDWESAIIILLFRKWFRYWEVPIKYRARSTIEWKKIRFLDWIRAISTLFRWRFKKLDFW